MSPSCAELRLLRAPTTSIPDALTDFFAMRGAASGP